MDTVRLKINGIEVEAPQGATIIEAARLAGVRIPTLCYLKGINAIGACRICLVEGTEGGRPMRGLVAACVYPVSEGMEVFTNTPKVIQSRKNTLELILSNHRMDCLSCSRNGNCELAALAKEYGVDQYRFGDGRDIPVALDTSSPHLVRDNSKCILCRRCVAVCRQNQYVAVIGTNERGFATNIGSAFDVKLAETSCIHCGQCITVCPTGALSVKDDTAKVWDAIHDPSKHVVVGPAPSVRAQLGECFGEKMGTNVEGKMVAALRRLGFDKVFDVDTAADMTIMEEGTELLERVKNGGTLPMITSCSPGWVKFCETYYPDFIPNLSSCKSPQQMYGALMKTYYAEKEGIDPKDIFVVSVMPCTAKKFEIGREDESASGYADIDVSITTVELASMIKRAGLDWDSLPDEEFDPAFGLGTGAGHIFGATGGVMEAALRTVYEVVTGETAPGVDYNEVRGTEDIKEATYDIGGMKVNVAVTSGLANAAKLLDSVRSGEKNYHFIEVMCCPGGCVNGGGQPDVPGYVRSAVDVRALRAKALYKEDEASVYRKSHENPVVKEIYKSYLGEPGSHKAHEILHTTYVARKKY